MSDSKKLIRLFFSDIGVLVHIALAVCAIALAIGSLSWEVFLILPAGWISYVVQEHLVHRFIFHTPAPRNQFLFNLLYRLHYGHHDQIHNRRLLFTPLWFSVPLGLLNLAVLCLFLPLTHAVSFVYGGAVTAYVLFEWCHLLSHFNARNRSKYVIQLSRDHGRHHHIDVHNWFTVSPGGNLVDTALGACPAQMSRMQHARTCGLKPNDNRLIAAREKFGNDRALANREPVAA